MPAGYAALPNPRSRPDEDELEAAFEASDDEDDRNGRNSESRPLNPGHRGDEHEDDDHQNEDAPPLATINPSAARPVHSRRQSTAAPGTYDFEAVDYDMPPPGSPPPNSWGNSNGIIPTSPILPPRQAGQGTNWIRRVLPARVADRLVRPQRRPRTVGGGGVDGVFANVTAKPTAPRQIQEGDNVPVIGDLGSDVLIFPLPNFIKVMMPTLCLRMHRKTRRPRMLLRRQMPSLRIGKQRYMRLLHFRQE